MKALLTIAIVFGLLLIFAGAVACVVSMPAWVCAGYGLMAAVALPNGLEAVGEIWAH